MCAAGREEAGNGAFLALAHNGRHCSGKLALDRAQVIAVAAGYAHTCALTSQGAVKCWGSNSVGQLGNGSTANALTPVGVSGLAPGVEAISAGAYHTCALTAQGAVLCWGMNSEGQLGNNSTFSPPQPVAVTGLPAGIAEIAAGGAHTCALTKQGAVWCWGDGRVGQNGDLSAALSAIPVAVQ